LTKQPGNFQREAKLEKSKCDWTWANQTTLLEYLDRATLVDFGYQKRKFSMVNSS